MNEHGSRHGLFSANDPGWGLFLRFSPLREVTNPLGGFRLTPLLVDLTDGGSAFSLGRSPHF